MFGLDRLERELKALLNLTRQEMHAGIFRLERKADKLMAQIDDMNAKLDTIANTETQLGQDIQTVVDFLKANPTPTPTDLSAQLAKLDAIAQKLVDTDASTLANLPPTPAPAPSRRKP